MKLPGSFAAMRSNRKPRLINRICTFPEQLSMGAGAVVALILAYVFLIRPDPVSVYFLSWKSAIGLLASAVFVMVIGALVFGAMLMPGLYRLCIGVNGAPYVPGDLVVILSGKHKGTHGRVAGHVGRGYATLIELQPSNHQQDILRIPQHQLFRESRPS